MLYTLFKLLSLLLLIIGATFILPFSCGLILGETEAALSFIPPFVFSLIPAIFSFIFLKKKSVKLSTRGSFVIVMAGWVAACLIGAVPYVLSGAIPHVADALFESVSGFSTTGATILSDVESLPRCINLWRTQTHWLGGMGIVALTVALLPLLGVGGFQLIKAETTGPEKGKMTPKITMTAKILWFIYLGMTVIQTILLMIAGMDFIDALSHAFSTLGTGGFSTRNGSIGSYNSVFIDWICIIFMFLAGINFSLYFLLFTGKLNEIKENTELKLYILIVTASSIIVAFSISPIYGSFFKSLRISFFHVLSIMTTTGFSMVDYAYWPYVAQMILLFLMFVGGCSGSTSGGVKVIRWAVLAKQAGNELRRLVHPHGVFSIRINNRAGRKDIVFSVASFMFVYFFLVAVTAFFAAFNGIDMMSSFSAGLSMVGNIGLGFNSVGPAFNYAFFSDATKLWFSFAMIAGRLELYTMIIFFFPAYWKK